MVPDTSAVILYESFALSVPEDVISDDISPLVATAVFTAVWDWSCFPLAPGPDVLYHAMPAAPAARSMAAVVTIFLCSDAKPPIAARIFFMLFIPLFFVIQDIFALFFRHQYV